MTRSFNSAELLRIWENGVALTPFERGQLLARVAGDDTKGHEIGQLSIGERDDILIGMHRRLFGADIEGLVSCPACNGQAELSFSLNDFPRPGSPHDKDSLSILSNGLKVDFRLPTVNDIASTLRHANEVDARRDLLSQCIIRAEADGKEIDGNSLPLSMVD